jgi:hypothetical protein
VGADKWTEDDGEWVAGELHGRATQRLRLGADLTATFDGEFERGIRKRGTLRVRSTTTTHHPPPTTHHPPPTTHHPPPTTTA